MGFCSRSIVPLSNMVFFLRSHCCAAVANVEDVSVASTIDSVEKSDVVCTCKKFLNVRVTACLYTPVTRCTTSLAKISFTLVRQLVDHPPAEPVWDDSF